VKNVLALAHHPRQQQNVPFVGIQEETRPAPHVATCSAGTVFCNGCKPSMSVRFAEKVCNLQELCHY